LLFLLIPIIVLPLLLGAFVELWQWIQKRWYVHHHNAQVFVVATRRHGWSGLIENNLIPTMPPDSTCVWDDFGAAIDPRLPRVVRQRAMKRPYLVGVFDRRLVVVALHEELLPLKNQAKRNAETRERIGHVISTAIRRSRA
jgi:hypothetical protein